MSTLGVRVLFFMGFSAGLIVGSYAVYFGMNLVRLALSIMFVSRRLSDPAYASAERSAASSVLEDVAMEFFPQWLPAPARLIWGASGLVTLIIRYALRVWWPVILAASVLTWRFSA
jgi:hypothetical protein